jgi:putative membrane protein
MKKLMLILSAAITVCLLQACKGNGGSIMGDDTVAGIDTSNLNIIVGANDARFVKEVGAGCLAEITIGKLARQKGKDKRIKNFGAMMVKDLTKGHGRLAALAQSKKIALPDTLSLIDKASIDTLAGKSGRAFDQAYLSKIKADYTKALVLFQATSKSAYDPQIKQFAAKNILTIQRHLDLIEAMHASVR